MNAGGNSARCSGCSPHFHCCRYAIAPSQAVQLPAMSIAQTTVACSKTTDRSNRYLWRQNGALDGGGSAGLTGHRKRQRVNCVVVHSPSHQCHRLPRCSRCQIYWSPRVDPLQFPSMSLTTRIGRYLLFLLKGSGSSDWVVPLRYRCHQFPSSRRMTTERISPRWTHLNRPL